MKKNNLILVWVLINTLGILGVFFWFSTKKQKIAYVDNVQVFSGFNMTKDLGKANEEKYKPMLVAYDSLVKRFSLLQDKKSNVSNAEMVSLQQQIYKKENELNQLKIQVRDDINKEVWSRLNGYMQDYGKQENIDLLLGAQGQGNIMYAQEHINVTKKFLDYANSRYEGN